ncbi:MAG TPA: GAF domain-containing protein, partial [Methylomirabilota bacterium]|nr:GAF domain-containing protein [Methylomirabilota bacterium]
MRRGSGPKKAPGKIKSKARSAPTKARPLATPAPRHLEERLAEALAQQTATGEILRVISSSPADAQPVFDAIVRNAEQLCDADFSAVVRFEAGLLHLVALNNLSPEEADSFRGLYPRPAERGFALGRAFVDGRVAHVEDVLADHDYDRRTLGLLVRATGYRTFLAVPILRGGVPIGAIGCARREVKPFSAAQIDLVRTFAEQAVIAIENVRLFQELEARNRDLAETLTQQTATAQILRVISSSPTDIQPVLDTIAASAARLCEAERCFVFRFDGHQLHFSAHHGFTPEALASVRSIWPAPPGRGTAAGRAVLDRRIAHIPDVREDREYAVAAVATAATFRGIIAVPMLREGVPIGVITLLRPKPGPFSPSQIALLETFADQAVIAIENVNLFGELERRNQALAETLEQQTATGEILRAISSSPTDIRPVLETVVQAAARFCGAPDVAILRVDRDILRGAAAIGPFGRELASGVGGIEALELPLTSGSVSGRAVLERRSIHVHDLLAEPEDELPIGRDLQRRFGHHTILATPLLREGTPLGVIVLFRTEVQPFSDRQLDLVKIFADQAVIAIENVRLFQALGARNAALSEALEQQTATSEMLKVISRSTVDLQPVLETVVESATRLCGATRGHIFRFDGEVLRFAVAYGAWPGFQEYLERNPTRPGPGSVAGRAAAERRAIHVDDVLAVPDYEYGPLVNEQDYRTVLAVPMLREDVLLGVIVILKARVEPFSEKQIELVTTFADQAV